MRIVQAVGWYFPEALGGTEVYVAALCRLMRKAGHDVAVAAPDAAHALERTYRHDDTPVYRYPIPSRPTREEAQGSGTARGAEKFHAWLAKERPDVVHLHTFVTGLGLPELRAAKQAGARTIVTTHSSSLGFLCMRGTLMQWGDRPCDGVAAPGKCAGCVLQQRGVPKPLARAIGVMPSAVARAASALPGRLATLIGMSDIVRRNIEREHELLALADRFVVLTDGARQILRANGFSNGHIIVNRLGTTMSAGREKSTSTERTTTLPLQVGYVGRFDLIKGVEVLARAVTLLERNLRVVVEFRGPVTSEAERAVVARLARIVRGDPRVRFADPVAHEKIGDVLRRYDLLCCPAVCFEGGPTVALEAQAVGTPVVGSRIGGLAEIVNDDVNGRLVAPGDAAALADVLRQAALEPATTVDRWRSHLPAPRTMAEVASDYLRLYAN